MKHKDQIRKRVLIVGAGLAGLAVARFLDPKQFEIEIVETKHSFRRLGYALIFMPPGVRALKRLGIPQSTIERIGKKFRENRLYNTHGKLLLTNSFLAIIRRFDAYMMVTRERLYRVLEGGIDKRRIQFGVRVHSIAIKNKKAVVSFTGGKKSAIYDLVIGADGIHSGIRAILFPRVKLRSLGLSLFWAWIPRRRGIYPKEMGSLGDEKAGIGFFNSGERRRSCMAFFVQTSRLPNDLEPSAYPAFLKKYFKKFGGIAPAVLKNLPVGNSIYLHHDYELDLKHWHRGPVIVIGDAAHGRSAFTGTGSMFALEDGFLLAKFLNANLAVSAAFKRFENLQSQRVRKLAMARVRAYLQDQRGIVGFLEKFFATSPLYRA